VDEPMPLPAFVRRQAEVNKAYQALQRDNWEAANRTLEHIRVTSIRIDSEDAVVNQVIRLLEKFKHVRR
jgi:hypothetical protein